MATCTRQHLHSTFVRHIIRTNSEVVIKTLAPLEKLWDYTCFRCGQLWRHLTAACKRWLTKKKNKKTRECLQKDFAMLYHGTDGRTRASGHSLKQERFWFNLRKNNRHHMIEETSNGTAALSGWALGFLISSCIQTSNLFCILCQPCFEQEIGLMISSSLWPGKSCHSNSAFLDFGN